MARSIHHSESSEGEPELSDVAEEEEEREEEEGEAGGDYEEEDESEDGLSPSDFFNTDAVFPFTDMPFFVPRAIDDQKVKNAAGGHIVPSVFDAKVVVMPYNPSNDLKKVLKAYDGLRDGTVAAVYPDWVLSVYYKGYASPPNDKAGCLVRDGTLARIAVADLGDDELRLDVMIALESNGAVIVPFDEADVCIIPSGHPFLTRIPTKYSGKQFATPEWVFDACKITRRVRSLPPASRSKQPRREPATRRGARGGQRASLVGRRPRGRNAFTAQDRHNLARFLAFRCPGGEGRKSSRLYVDLVANDADDPVLGWAARHPAEGWRQHYRDNHNSEWDDGTVLDDLIEDYIDAGIDRTLKTARERKAARSRQQGSNRRSSSQARLPEAFTKKRPRNDDARRSGSSKRRPSATLRRAAPHHRSLSPDALEVAAEVGAALGEAEA